MSIWQTKVNQRAAGAELQITGESYVIGADVANFVFLNEVPRLNTPSSVTVVQGATPFTEITSGSPAVGQFRVYYEGRLLGAIEFNAADNGKSVSVSYFGRGSNVFARDINRLQTEKLDADGSQPLTGSLRAPNGSAVSPSYSFATDTALGLFRQASNVLGITVNSAQIVAVSSAGLNVLSGTLQVGGVNVSLTGHSHALSSLTGQLDLSQINASGTRSADTYLRGDGTWAVIATGGAGITQAFADSRYLQLTGGTLTGALTVTGQPVTADRYLFGSARLALRAGTNEQAAIISWNGLQLIGARQATVDIAPATLGGNLVAAGVIIPNQTAGAVALYVRGASAQSAALTQWVDIAGSILASVASDGIITAADFRVGGVSVSLSSHSHVLSSLSGTLDLSQLNASGTRDATTFLRGDGTWQPIAATGGGITLAEGDARYLRLAGGTVTGNTNFTGTLSVNSIAVSVAGHSHAATDLTSGTLADARLSTNVVLLNTGQTFTASKTFSFAGTTNDALFFRIAADTLARFVVRTDGQLSWGPGGNASQDISLGRTSAAVLTLTGSLNVTSSLTVNGTAVSVSGHTHSASDLTSGVLADSRLSSNVRQLNVAQTSVASETFALTNTTDFAVSVRTSADTQLRFRIRADGQLVWGPGGTTAPDVTLSRSGSATLTLSGSLALSGGLTVGGNSVSTAGHTHAANDVTSGTFADARLSANVVLLDRTQTFTGQNTFALSSASAPAIQVRTSGDAQARLIIRTDGFLLFGSGSALQDVTVARTATNTLSLTGSLDISGSLLVGGAAVSVAGHAHSASDITSGVLPDGRLSANVMLLDTLRISTVGVVVARANATDIAYTARVSTDTQPRFTVRSDGQIAWGVGSTTAQDVFLARTAGATLTLTGTMNATGGLQVGGTAVSLAGHTHSAADLTSGTLADARLSANIPRLDGANIFSVAQTITRATLTTAAMTIRAAADTQLRLQILANGQIGFGDGATASPDVTLARTGAATVTLTGLLNASAGLQVNGVAVSLSGHTHAFSAITGQLNISQINASGTPSSTTYLRGDGTWATVSGGGGGDLTQAAADARYLQLTGGTVASLAITGNLSSLRGVAYSFPTVQGGANTVLVNNGSGTLTWATVPTHTHSGGDITTGTVADARLSTNVMLLNGLQQVTAAKYWVSSVAQEAITFRLNADTFTRMVIETDGRIRWGSGSANLDINLLRSAASTLQLQGNFSLTGLFIPTVGTTINGNGSVAVNIGSTSGSGIIRVNLSGSSTLTLSGGHDGGCYVIEVYASGNTWTLGTGNVRFANGASQPTWPTTGCTVLTVYKTGSLFYVVPFGQNFATT